MEKYPCILDAARVEWFGVTLVYSQAKIARKKARKEKNTELEKTYSQIIHTLQCSLRVTILPATVFLCSSDPNETCSEILKYTAVHGKSKNKYICISFSL